MDKIIITWRDSAGTKMTEYIQEVVTSELASYANSKAIEAVQVALVAEKYDDTVETEPEK